MNGIGLINGSNLLPLSGSASLLIPRVDYSSGEVLSLELLCVRSMESLCWRDEREVLEGDEESLEWVQPDDVVWRKSLNSFSPDPTRNYTGWIFDYRCLYWSEANAVIIAGLNEAVALNASTGHSVVQFPLRFAELSSLNYVEPLISPCRSRLAVASTHGCTLVTSELDVDWSVSSRDPIARIVFQEPDKLLVTVLQLGKDGLAENTVDVDIKDPARGGRFVLV
jgi:hypothetical protein